MTLTEREWSVLRKVAKKDRNKGGLRITYFSGADYEVASGLADKHVLREDVPSVGGKSLGGYTLTPHGRELAKRRMYSGGGRRSKRSGVTEQRFVVAHGRVVKI